MNKFLKKIVATAISLAIVGGGAAGATAATGKLKALAVLSPSTVGAATVAKGVVAFPKVNEFGKQVISPCYRDKSEYLTGGINLTWASTDNVTATLTQLYPNPSSKPIAVNQEIFVAKTGGLAWSCPRVSNATGYSTTSVTSEAGIKNAFRFKFSSANKSYLAAGAEFSLTLKSSGGAIIYNRHVKVPKLDDFNKRREYACATVVAVGSVYMLTGSAFQMGAWGVETFASITGDAKADAASKGYSFLSILMTPPDDTSSVTVADVFTVTKANKAKLTLEEQRLGALVNLWVDSHKDATNEEILAQYAKRFPKAGGFLVAVETVKGIKQSLADHFEAAVAQNTWAIKQMNAVCD